MSRYGIFYVGGDPSRIAFLADELSRKIDDLQSSGWEIDGVDLINNTRAWDIGKQMYVETPEYIIRAKKEDVCRGRRLSDEESQAALTMEQIEQQKVIRDMKKYLDREVKNE